jgi:ubiquinone/menaquinone biosynthesis C-methylase UbiE
MRTEILDGLTIDDLYTNKNYLVRNLFLDRIQTALDLADINDNSVILDIGCGSGHLLRSIREFSRKCECWATDILDSKIMETVDCKFQVADARKLPFEDGYFDVVFTLDILEHIQHNVDLAIKEVRRVLKPNGIAILSGPTESKFYRFCRSILFFLERNNHQRRETQRQNIVYIPHYHTVYQLEDKFMKYAFTLSRARSLPGFPLPPLFRVSRFRNQV